MEIPENWQDRFREARKNIVEEYTYVHDNIILSYQVDICNKELKMITKYIDEELVTITFTGVSTHRFECVAYHNMLMGIWHVSTDYFIDKNRELLEQYLRCGAPIVAKDCDKLKEYLNESGQKVFEIGAVMGLQGFVFAEEIKIDRVMLK